MLGEEGGLGEEGECRELERVKPKRSILFIVGIESFLFAYGAMITTLAMITLPAEAERMFPQASAIALAGFLFLAGVTQLVGVRAPPSAPPLRIVPLQKLAAPD